MYNIDFNIGDKVYPIVATSERVKIDCPICETKGTIFYKSRELRCPECGGTKVVYEDRIIWQPARTSVIKEIIIRKTKTCYVLKEGTRRGAPYYCDTTTFDVKDCFKDPKSALNACELRNHKCK